MALTDELSQLAQLHAAGSLSDAEFEEAKKQLIFAAAVAEEHSTGSGGHAVEKFVDLEREKFEYGKGVQWIGLILFILFGMFMCSQMQETENRFKSFQQHAPY